MIAVVWLPVLTAPMVGKALQVLYKLAENQVILVLETRKLKSCTRANFDKENWRMVMSLENNSVKVIFVRAVAVLILLAIMGQGSLRAQSTGTISGTVADATGAVVPGAEITVRNVETGITRVLTTNERGRYAVPQLPPGSYEISASTSGFQTEVRSGITLTIGREAMVDFSLTVGSVTERVEVTGEAPLIETTTSTVSGMIDSKQMRDIPLNSRSFIE